METMDRAFGVQADGRELAEREYRICMVDTSTKLLTNKIDAASLLAAVASDICSNDLTMIYSFEKERRGEVDGRSAAEKVRQSMMEEMTGFIVKKRAGMPG